MLKCVLGYRYTNLSPSVLRAVCQIEDWSGVWIHHCEKERRERESKMRLKKKENHSATPSTYLSVQSKVFFLASFVLTSLSSFRAFLATYPQPSIPVSAPSPLSLLSLFVSVSSLVNFTSDYVLGFSIAVL